MPSLSGIFYHLHHTFFMRRLLFICLLHSLLWGQAMAQQPANPITYETLKDIPYRDKKDKALDAYMQERCKLDLYYPKGQKGFATIVWFHGGGLQGGEKELPEPLKNQGFAILGVNYRLYPKIKGPGYIDDTAAAVAWAFRHIAEYGGDPNLIFVGGHSAGGYLSSMVGMDKHWLAAYGIDANRIAALFPMSGHSITHFTQRQERNMPGTQAVVDSLAPLYHVRKDLPPMVLVTGDRELELLGRYEENAYLWRMMKLVGHERTYLHELDGFDHGSMLAPSQQLIVRYLKQFVEESKKK